MPLSTDKKWNGRQYNFDFTDPGKPMRTFRTRPPAHFIFEIESYSKLLQSLKDANNLNVFETPEFEAGGYKWVMRIYPNGRSSTGNLALYLRRKASTTARNPPSEVIMKFFILDYVGNQYLVIEDVGESRIDVRGDERGISEALEKTNFELATNGFVYEDKCTFGAEVYITSGEAFYSRMTFVKTVSRRSFTVRFGPFNTGDPEPLISSVITTVLDGQTYTWKVHLYREGYDTGSTTHYSVYLDLDSTAKVSNGNAVFVGYKIGLQNKRTFSYVNEKTHYKWYNETHTSSGFAEYIDSTDLSDPSKGYLPSNGVFTFDIKLDFLNFFVLKTI